MTDTARRARIHPAWWTLVLLTVIVSLIALVCALFVGAFRTFVPVTLVSDRAGLIMDPGGKVKMRGVEVGKVGQIRHGADGVSLQLEIYPDEITYIPANVAPQIRATTAFGAKYVDLVYPSDPSDRRLAAGQVLQSRNVSTEVNTVFQNLVGVLKQIDTGKLNAVLTALSEGVRGQGDTIGRATTAANEVLLAVNPRAETIRADWKSFEGFSDAYGAAAQDILRTLDAASTTSTTISKNASALDALLLNVIGLSNSGIGLIGPNQDNVIKAINVVEPTTNLLLKYNPELTCLIVGGKWFLDNGGSQAIGGDGRTSILDAAILLGNDPYRYPENLPIVGARGGPGGKPGCGSLPIVDNNWPVRALVTNTGWGTGVDIRPNPGIGFPGYANYLPVTRAIPEPPSVRYPGGPAPGPIPYPGAPPYGAQLYAPDGSPLWPGLPPAPPPGAPREPGPPLPGSEPFTPAVPGVVNPTPLAVPPPAPAPDQTPAQP